MRLCSYTVVHDCGFAPNPFADYCTLAACTPNHQGIRLSAGDWIMGHSAAKQGRRLIYAMEVSKVLDFDAYYNNPRFERKKPRFDLTWREACGDNIYHRGHGGAWVQERTLFHDTPKQLAQDTRHPSVFVAERYFYFGAKGPAIPERFRLLLRDRQGCKCSYPVQVVEGFVAWLCGAFAPGLLGEPRDLEWARALLGSRGAACRSGRRGRRRPGPCELRDDPF
jgi:hypothetical protein